MCGEKMSGDKFINGKFGNFKLNINFKIRWKNKTQKEKKSVTQGERESAMRKKKTQRSLKSLRKKGGSTRRND